MTLGMYSFDWYKWLYQQATSGMTNTTFEILRLSNVPSDGVGHKVTVGLIELKPEFSYEAVPKKSGCVLEL